MFFHLNSVGNRIMIGRLHLIECDSIMDFNSYQVGQEIEAKVLKVTESEIAK